MFTKIDHVAIHVRDVERSRQFYKQYFNFVDLSKTSTGSGRPIIYLQLADTILELIEMFEGEFKGSHFCVHAKNFKSAYEYLLAQGVLLLQAAHPTAARKPNENNWQRAVFAGPDGEAIEIRG